MKFTVDSKEEFVAGKKAVRVKFHELSTSTDKISGLVAKDRNSLSFQLEHIISRALDEVVGEKPKKIKKVNIMTEHPANLNYGDYSSNIAMILASRLNMKPIDLANRLAEKIREYIKKNLSITIKADSIFPSDISIYPKNILENISVAGPGFLNMTLRTTYLISRMVQLLKNKNSFRLSQSGKRRKVMVEFAHPNTHKAFHIGHLRNISIGESVVRILEAVGVEVIRANYQGDVGMHIAKALYPILNEANFQAQIPKVSTLHEKIEFLAKAYVFGSKAYEEDESAREAITDINYLIYACAQKFQEERGIIPGSTDYTQFVKSRKVELDKVYELWKKTRQWSLDYFEKIYKKVYTRYDRYYFESECLVGVDIAKDAVKKGILEESDGAIIFNGKPYDLDTRVFVNSLGLPTYEAKELALAEKEFSEFGDLDKNIHIVGPEQSSFFKVTFKAEELLDARKYKGRQYHLIYGWVRLKHGKMSSREGKVITGEWLLDEAGERIKKIMETADKKLQERFGNTVIDSFRNSESQEVAAKVAVAAVKYSMLKVNPKIDIAFDMEESISFEGDSGPYLMYTYARCRSVTRKAKIKNQKLKTHIKNQKENEDKKTHQERAKHSPGVEELRNAISNYKPNLEELAILRALYRFDEEIAEAAKSLSPSFICSFLFDLAKKYNLFYNKHSILNPKTSKHLMGGRMGSPELEESQITNFRLALTLATAEVIKRGLYLLGIETVERM